MYLWSKATKMTWPQSTYECVLKWQLHIEGQSMLMVEDIYWVQWTTYMQKNWSKGLIREKWTHALKKKFKNSLVFFQKSSCKMTQKCKWPQGHMEGKCSYCKRDWDQNEDENCWKIKQMERSTNNHKKIHNNNNLSKEVVVGFFPWKFPCWENELEGGGM
jgi:hypothetical protein